MRKEKVIEKKKGEKERKKEKGRVFTGHMSESCHVQ